MPRLTPTTPMTPMARPMSSSTASPASPQTCSATPRGRFTGPRTPTRASRYELSRVADAGGDAPHGEGEDVRAGGAFVGREVLAAQLAQLVDLDVAQGVDVGVAPVDGVAQRRRRVEEPPASGEAQNGRLGTHKLVADQPVDMLAHCAVPHQAGILRGDGHVGL